MAWSKTFTGSINNGEPYNEGDQPQREAFNAPFQNTLYLKEKVEEQATTIANQASTIANQGTAITAQGQTLAGHGTTLTNHESRLTNAEEEIKSLEGAGNSFGKLFYNLGAFDTVLSVVGNTATIRRKTGYYNLSERFLERYDLVYVRPCSGGNQIGADGMDFLPNNATGQTDSGFANYPDFIVGNGDQAWNLSDKNVVSISWIALNKAGNFTTKEQYKQFFTDNKILVQYETATYYDEEVIAGTPIDAADTTQLAYQREEWKKGLNLCRSYTKGNWELYPVCYLKPNTTYTMLGKSHDYYAVKVIIGGVILWENDYTHVFGNSFKFITPATIQEGWQTIEISVNRPNPDEDITDIMLVEGTHAYPYEPYNGKVVHEKDLAPINTSIEDIERRLSEMGFKEGVAILSEGTATINSLKKQGKLCVFDLWLNNPTSNSTITIPQDFKPKTNISITLASTTTLATFAIDYIIVDGVISLGDMSNVLLVIINSAGWETN